LALANLNWIGLLICALVEAAFLGGIVWSKWRVYQAGAFLLAEGLPDFLADLAMTSSHFACSFLFGMAVAAFWRVKAFWQRLLLLVPGLLVMVVSEAILFFSSEAWSRSIWLYVLGLVYGIALMYFGLVGEEDRGIRKKLRSK
jgi:uncharacterized membrane protein